MEATLNALVGQYDYTGDRAAILAIYAADATCNVLSLTLLAKLLCDMGANTAHALVADLRRTQRALTHGWRVVSPRSAQWKRVTGCTMRDYPPFYQRKAVA